MGCRRRSKENRKWNKSFPCRLSARRNQRVFPVVQCNDRMDQMHLSGESLLVILFVGLIAGWLSGKIVDGAGFGLIGDIAIGIVGALIGSWLMPRLGLHLASGIVSAIIVATIG